MGAPSPSTPQAIEGSLAATPLDRVLAACRRAQWTGLVRIESEGKSGRLQLCGGAVSRAEVGGWSGPGVLATLRSLRDGRFELEAALPDGVASDASERDAAVAPLVRQCQERGLTCSLLISAGAERAQLEVRGGAIERIELNGRASRSALAQVMRWPRARVRAITPPLDLGPALGRATPLSLTAMPLPPRTVDPTPVRALQYDGDTTERFERSRVRGPLLWWAMIATVVAVCTALSVFT